MKTIKFILGMAMPAFALAACSSASVFATDIDKDLTISEAVAACYTVKAGSTINMTVNADITCADGDAITVEKGATLILSGTGTIQSNTRGKAALVNNGTVTMSGVTLYTNNAVNNYYAILNHGDMTIKDGTVKMENGHSASLIDNGYYDYTKSKDPRIGFNEAVNNSAPTLTIENGTFDGGMNTVKNDDNATLTINGGTYSNNYQVAVMNNNIATINGGTFNVPTGYDKTTVYNRSYGADSVDKGQLAIAGGTFNGEHALEISTDGQAKDQAISITGGNFNTSVSFLNTNDGFAKGNTASAIVKATGGNYSDTTVMSVADNGYIVTGKDGSYSIVKTDEATLEQLEQAAEIAGYSDNGGKSADTLKLMAEKKAAEEKIAALQEELAGLKDKNAELEKKQSELEGEIDDLNTKLAEAEKRAAAAETKTEEDAKTIEDLNKNVDDLEDEVEDLKKKVNDLSKEQDDAPASSETELDDTPNTGKSLTIIALLVTLTIAMAGSVKTIDVFKR